ncbi:MAG: viroplasmin family protein, partial [Prevotella sp.]|nr:viroplasmin family protein [Prevotella sp.]
MAKKKYYVVWKGVNPGIYDNWNDAKLQVNGYEGAVYKSFPTREEAVAAFNEEPKIRFGKPSKPAAASYTDNPAVIQDSLAVDAACSGNPGLMEYRGVYVKTGKQVFHQGPFEQGTNNIGEFLAIVHGLALLKQKQLPMPLY